ncbi:MAG TPA: SEC-C domain-containing protein [Pseudonocardiaceae bacterium]|nr:SEC-C domain-containing protein [Pseudonocardiaceae bacterium]
MATETDLQTDVETVAALLTEDRAPDQDRTPFLLETLAAATDDALDWVADRVECHTARGGTVEPQLAPLRSQARSREAKAAVALLAARAAEGAGDCATARDLIEEALSQRPGLEPALHDAAQYAATRGDYPAAERYLRRAERPSPLRPGLTAALAVTAGNVPRNDPCPCGSGRKFKVCCRRDGAPPLAARAQLVYALLGTYAERAPGLEIVTPLLDRTEDRERCAMFCVDLALFRKGLVQRFLATWGRWLRPDEHDLITAWQQIPFTCYEVLQVQRGTAVTLRALPDGEPIDLEDPLFSACAERLELFCGRLLSDGTTPRMLTLPVHVPRHRRRDLVELLGSDPSAEQLADFLAPEPPVQFRNSDGDDLQDCRVTYRVPHPAPTVDLLTGRLTQTGETVVAWQRPVPDGRTINLGQIRWDGDDFTVTANSPARLAELEAILREVAPDAVARDRHAERLSPAPEGRDGRVLIMESYVLPADSGDSTTEAADRMSQDAEAGWLDTAGVIGALTPREAATATDPAVRAELHSVIDDVEAALLQAQRAGRPTAGLMNPQRLRHALALDER